MSQTPLGCMEEETAKELFGKPKIRTVCGSKHRKLVMYDRVGRLYRAEKKYRYQKDHSGKGTTLRSHRKGS